MKKVLRFFLIAVGVIVLIATFKFLWDNSRPEILTYEIITTKFRTINNITTIPGNIEPRTQTEVKSEIQGTIVRILKKEGDYVNTGEAVATIIPNPEVAHVNQAQSILNLANINLDREKSNFARQKKQFEDGDISRQSFEQYEALYKSAIEEKENAEDNLEIVTTGFSKRSNQIDNTKIRAKSSGTILEIPVKEGNKVIHTNPFNLGTTIAIIANMNDLIFKGTIDESEIAKVRRGMPINISIGAMPNQKIEAFLEEISPQGKKESGSVLFEITARLNTSKNMTSLMRAHYSANAELIIDQAKNVITIPESCVEFGKDGSTYVYVLKSGTEDAKKQIFTKTKIEVGLYDGNNIEIRAGLEFNDKIRGKLRDANSR